MTTLTAQVINDITLERIKQDEQWGGGNHDDGHGPHDWCRYIHKQNQAAYGAFVGIFGDRMSWRSRMVKIAALAIAAIESHDRLKAEDDAVEAGGL